MCWNGTLNFLARNKVDLVVEIWLGCIFLIKKNLCDLDHQNKTDLLKRLYIYIPMPMHELSLSIIFVEKIIMIFLGIKTCE